MCLHLIGKGSWPAKAETINVDVSFCNVVRQRVMTNSRCTTLAGATHLVDGDPFSHPAGWPAQARVGDSTRVAPRPSVACVVGASYNPKAHLSTFWGEHSQILGFDAYLCMKFRRRSVRKKILAFNRRLNILECVVKFFVGYKFKTLSAAPPRSGRGQSSGRRIYRTI